MCYSRYNQKHDQNKISHLYPQANDDFKNYILRLPQGASDFEVEKLELKQKIEL
ncbi:hypothetical protein MADA3029_760010 [Vibrio nigripulchritudo MADA3029]|nr:hypothetical protein VIBNIMADA3020_670010 [Vibrio nigripulchritudo MADA3020]CCN55269.1 hypothetical protein VIBNIMADA3021_730010 [Vibrio nigripulchritudo MADA3021]CCN61412.1 hypothetical protein MADA3029_760010 [Vibrio nigripulchritudo MADA3029]